MSKRILFFLFLFLFSYPSLSSGSILLDRIVAIVNKEVITWSDLYKAMEFEATAEVKAMKESDKMKIFKENESLFLENMIDMKLQIQEASKKGISASEEDVNRTIDGIKKKYSMTDEMFKDALLKEGFTLSEYKKKIYEQIIIGRLIEQEVRSKIIVSEVDIDRYLSENKNILMDSEGFVLSLIFLKRAEDKRQTEERAMELYNRLKAGESFEDLARKYSEDASAMNGGDIGFIKKRELSRDFLGVIANMNEGDISEPFWGTNGIYILRLNEKKEFKTEQQLREAVRQKLLSDRFSREYKNWIRSLRERAYVEIKL